MGANFICDVCKKEYNQNCSLQRHIRLHHQQQQQKQNRYCNECNENINQGVWIYHIRTLKHKQNSLRILDDQNNIKCFDNCFQNRISSFRFENTDKENLIPEKFFATIKDKVIKVLNDALQRHTALKFNFEMHCKYMLVKDKVTEIIFILHQTKMSIATLANFINDFQRYYSSKCDNLIEKMGEFQERDSGLTLTEIIHLDVNVNKYGCLKGSQYICLPPSISNKKGCINVQNNDVYCFKWAIISALYQVSDHSNRCSSYKVNDIEADRIILENGKSLDFSNLSFPLAVNKIQIFEDNNPWLSVNVFGLDERYKKEIVDGREITTKETIVVGPYYFSKEEKCTHINLLLLEDEDRFHYVWIKNISR